MVIDLNKCIGCHTCSTACKSLWTDEPGQEHMLWHNVETKPGPGYPTNWEDSGGGWENGKLKPGQLMSRESHGAESSVNHQAVFFEGTQERLQQEQKIVPE
jgi:complex iron-sulfur molybdoenzyme family reductase subunit beta